MVVGPSPFAMNYIFAVDALYSWGFEGIMGIKFDAVDETQEDSNT